MNSSSAHSVPLGELLLQCCQDEKRLHHGLIYQMPTVQLSFGNNRASVIIKFPDLQEVDDFDFSVTPIAHTHHAVPQNP
jgi:hypothetical protein